MAFYDATAGNSGGAYRSTDVDIEPTTDSGAGYNVGWTRAGEWLEYTVDVASTGTYTLEARVAGKGPGATFHVEVDGVDRTGLLAVTDTGGWQIWDTKRFSGIPITAGRRIIRVVFDSAATSGGAGNYNWFRLTASTPSTSSKPFGGTPAALPGVLQAENFDAGGQGVAYYDVSAGNTGGVYRTGGDVDIGATGDPENGGYHVAWTRVGEWLKYTVHVKETRNYTLNVRVANLGSGAAFHIEVDGVALTEAVPLPNTGGWDLWRTIQVPLKAPLVQGERVIRLVMLKRNTENSGVGNYGFLAFQ